MELSISTVGNLYATTRKELGNESLREDKEKQLFENNFTNEKKDLVDKAMSFASKLPAGAIEKTGAAGIVGSSIAVLAGLKVKNFKAIRYGTAVLFGSVAAYLTGQKLSTLKEVPEVKKEVVEEKEPIKTHTVKPDETLYSLAKKYKTTVDNLKELNGLTDNMIKIGAELVVPDVDVATETPTAQKNEKTQTLNTTTYKVAKKETLYYIANEYGISVEQLKKLNNLKNNDIKIGQELIVPEKVEGKATQLFRTTTHKVAKKETLYHIANEYGISVEQLKNLNNLKNNDIKIGQELIVPEK